MDCKEVDRQGVEAVFSLMVGTVSRYLFLFAFRIQPPLSFEVIISGKLCFVLSSSAAGESEKKVMAGSN